MCTSVIEVQPCTARGALQTQRPQRWYTVRQCERAIRLRLQRSCCRPGLLSRLSRVTSPCAVFACCRRMLLAQSRVLHRNPACRRASVCRAASTMVAQVGVVTTIGCPYCKRAKAALKDRNVEYTEADLGTARDVLAKVKETTGQGTVPQVSQHDCKSPGKQLRCRSSGASAPSRARTCSITA